jgi:hypothetical protein
MPPLSTKNNKARVDRTVAKEWTEILVPWIQVIGLVAAGIYGLVEYRDHQAETKIQASVDYVTRLNSEELRDVNLKLFARYRRQYVRFEAKHPTFTPTDYYNFVMTDVLMFGQDSGIETNVDALLGFLDDGVTCTQAKICDETTIRSTIGDFGKTIIESYYPFMCFSRDLFGPGYMDRVNQFYEKASMDKACFPYQADIKKTRALLGS